MGLISRVSSRTYRCQKFKMVEGNERPSIPNENNNNIDNAVQNDVNAEDAPVAFSTDDYLSQIQAAYTELYDYLKNGPVYFKIQELEPRLLPQITHFIHQSELAK